MTGGKKLAASGKKAPPVGQADFGGGKGVSTAHSTCSRCGGRSPLRSSLCLPCQDDLRQRGAGFARKLATNKAVVRERKKALGW